MSPSPNATPSAPISGRRVLVVDDDAGIRDVLADFLEGEGYQVASARDGSDALLKAKLERPDVIVLDLMMPTMSGWGFRAEQMRDPALADVPVVIASAFTCRMEVAAHLQKPFDLGRLLAAVRRAAA